MSAPTVKATKARLVVGARLLCVENKYRPELNGRTRIVTQVGATVWRWKHEDEDQISFSVWPSGVRVLDADTFVIPLHKRDDSTVTPRFLAAR